jgi:hypothetical protein
LARLEMRKSRALGNDFIMPIAYHKDVPTEVFVPIAMAFLAVATLLLHRRLRGPPPGDETGRSNWGATAAIVVGLAAAMAYGLSWIVPTEAETGVRRTIGDVGIVIALAYVLAVGPLLGIAGVTLVDTRGHKLRAIIGFLFGFVGLAWAVGSIVACIVSDGCFH